jgi:hypothetical protein
LCADDVQWSALCNQQICDELLLGSVHPFCSNKSNYSTQSKEQQLSSSINNFDLFKSDMWVVTDMICKAHKTKGECQRIAFELDWRNITQMEF